MFLDKIIDNYINKSIKKEQEKRKEKRDKYYKEQANAFGFMEVKRKVNGMTVITRRKMTNTQKNNYKARRRKKSFSIFNIF